MKKEKLDYLVNSSENFHRLEAILPNAASAGCPTHPLVCIFPVFMHLPHHFYLDIAACEPEQQRHPGYSRISSTCNGSKITFES